MNEKKWLIILKIFTNLDYTKMFLGANYDAKKDETKGTWLEVLTPKQMLPRLPIALAQEEAGNNSGSLLIEIRQIVYSLYQSKEITKKVDQANSLFFLSINRNHLKSIQ